jgi:hypothetical protein
MDVMKSDSSQSGVGRASDRPSLRGDFLDEYVDFMDIRAWISHEIQSKSRVCGEFQESRIQTAKVAFRFHLYM